MAQNAVDLKALEALEDEIFAEYLSRNAAPCFCSDPFSPAHDDEGLDDWEGPDGDGPGYTERDDEAFDEMVRDDMAGRF